MAGHAVPGLCLPLWPEGQAVTTPLPPSQSSTL